jgi:hypothetical protein
VKAHEELRARRVEQVVRVEVERVDDRERRLRAFELRERNRAVERDDRVRGDSEQLVVQLEDLTPVGLRGGRGVAVHGVDGRLDLVRAGSVAAEAAPDDRLPLGDELTIPERAVLVGEEHHRPVGCRACGASRLGEQEQREEAECFGLVGHQVREQPRASRTASAQRSARINSSPSDAV